MKIIKHTGQALTEYVLYGVLVAVACMGGMQLLSAVLEGRFQQVSNYITQTPLPVAVNNGGGGTLPTPAANSSAAPLPADAATGTYQVTLQNGTTIQLNNFPTDLSNLVETVGANGTSTVIANQLLALIAQLQAANALNPIQVGVLTDLANQAHRMASIQKLVEDTIEATGGDSASYRNTMVTVDGELIPVDTAGMLVGYDCSYNMACDPSSIDGSSPVDPYFHPGARPETQKFINLFNQAQNSGALADPAILAAIKSLSTEILFLSDEVANIGYLTYHDQLDLATYKTQLGNNQKTNANAIGICVSGNGTDNGVKCTP